MKKQVFTIPSLTVEDLSAALYTANMKLTLTNKALAKSERMRQELLSNLSHDLRSPIAAIRSYTEYLLSCYQPAQDEEKEEEKDEAFSILGHIQSKTLLLEHLINQMLLISTLDATSQQQLNCQQIKIGIFLEDFFFSAQADLKYKDCKLKINVAQDFPCLVNIDTALIYRVLDNLFTNALKFSPTTCSIILEANYQDGAVIVSVADKGMGISQVDTKKIFERSYKASAARTPNNALGCGLGLSIAETIIQKHGGRIWCESVLGEGSTFYFTLPQTIP